MDSWLIHLLRLAVKGALVSSFIFISLNLLSSYLGPLKISINSKNVDQKTLFSVTGEGSVSVKPDIATISMGIVVQNPSVTEGQKKSNEIINRTTNDLKALGVSEKDIKTVSYNIYPNYTYDNGKQSLNGYNINIDLSIKVRDFELLNKVIDTATASGVNQVGGVSFDVEKKEEATNKARAEAVRLAKEKALRLSSLAGLKLGRIVNLSEGQSLERPPFVSMDAKGIGGGGGETQVQPGQTEVKVSVTLDYETL